MLVALAGGRLGLTDHRGADRGNKLFRGRSFLRQPVADFGAAGMSSDLLTADAPLGPVALTAATNSVRSTLRVCGDSCLWLMA